MIEIDHPVARTASEHLEKMNIQPGKLYPFGSRTVELSEIFDRTRDFMRPGIIQVSLIQRALESYQSQNGTVRFSTCLRRAMNDLGVRKFFDVEMVQKISEIVSDLLSRSSLYVEAYTGPVNWSRGSFGNPNSCFWSERPGAKFMMNALFDANMGFAFRIYSGNGNGLPHPENEKVRGYGRMWALCYKEGLALFNPYPAHHLFSTYVRQITSMTGYAASRVMEMWNVNDEDVLYINKGEGVVISDPEELAEHGHIRLQVPDSQPCQRCKEVRQLNDMVYCHENHGFFCRHCATRIETPDCIDYSRQRQFDIEDEDDEDDEIYD